MEGAKKFGKAMFTNKDGSLDKTAVLAAASFGLTYADALRIANEAGEELPKEEYDEALKAEYKAKNDAYLKNFFGGKADGGRIGYARGSIDNESEDIKKLKELISGDIIENQDPDMDEMKEKMGIEELTAGTGINFSRQEKSYLFRRLGGSGGADRSYTMPNLYRILSNPSRYPEDARILKEIAVMGLNKKDGGRIGFEKGANKDYEFMKLIDTSDADRKEKAINDALEMYRKEYPRMSEEDIFTLVMQEFAPNMQSLQDDGSYKKASELPTPKIKLGDKIEDRVDLIKKTDGGVGPQTSLSLRMNLLNDLVEDGTITKKQYEDALLKGSAFVEEDGYRVRLGPFDFTGRGGEKITKMIDKYEDYDNYAMGGEVPVRKNQGGVMELDYRETGGFVPVGIKERADDVPAMLSKNEFVMTADAVRGIGNGDVEKGAEKLYGVMKQAEKVGRA
jgi:hypothetical protein